MGVFFLQYGERDGLSRLNRLGVEHVRTYRSSLLAFMLLLFGKIPVGHDVDSVGLVVPQLPELGTLVLELFRELFHKTFPNLGDPEFRRHPMQAGHLWTVRESLEQSTSIETGRLKEAAVSGEYGEQNSASGALRTR